MFLSLWSLSCTDCSLQIWSRRAQLRNDLGNIAREIVLPGYELEKYRVANDKERLSSGISALVKDDNFTRHGKLYVRAALTLSSGRELMIPSARFGY